ncbi:production factor 1 [Seminavis robusta]|uniref:Production factor 1 n=1 Tax=Seminavis robusta TaxID=568900 RepID=A0A9N8E891_9STRA|nr:production factor 1 [Seminavis robusta]|eukprot:Sro792_g203050.1 production factor 1 (352) ;mRNA; f:6773-7828
MAGKKKPDPSLKGKKPMNKARKGKAGTMTRMRNPSHIGNKLKRSEMYGKYLEQKRKLKDEARRERREKEATALGDDDEKAKQTPRTLDNAREAEATLVAADDVEVQRDEDEDEFAPYFDGERQPKVLITTRPRPSQNLFYFIADLQQLIPGLSFYPRKSFSVKEICQFAQNRDFTHVIILSEKSKQCNGMTISHVSKDMAGPTAFFKVSNVVTAQKIPKHGRATHHIPELNLHGFATRMGHRIGRLLGSLFPARDAEFQGRQVVTFHNQRDFLFVRHHRYIFDEIEDEAKIKRQEKDSPMPHINTRLQELGPRFTLKLRWLQEGTFDTQFGEYEWIHKRKEMDITRRKFHL